MSLFNQHENIKDPLAYRMAPSTLDEYAGQEHILGRENPEKGDRG